MHRGESLKYHINQQSSNELFAWNAATCFRFISVTLSVTPHVRLIRSQVQRNGNWHVRLYVIWNKQGELISFNWNTIRNSPEFNSRHTGCIFYGAHKRGSCLGMQDFCAEKNAVLKGTIKENIYRSATNTFTKISDLGGASPRKIHSTGGKL